MDAEEFQCCIVGLLCIACHVQMAQQRERVQAFAIGLRTQARDEQSAFDAVERKRFET